MLRHGSDVKVYWENSASIIPPHDGGISEAILKGEVRQTTGSHEAKDVTIEMTDRYFAELSKLVSPTNLKFCYSPMHGVGLPFTQRAISLLHPETTMIVVEEQAHPDPEFSTVAFPNPEEKGALDLAMRTADHHGLRLVMATDPDADRLVFLISPLLTLGHRGEGR